MPDFRVAETAAEHPKLRAAGLAAFGLWTAAGAWAMRELTDGWVPAYYVQTWPSGKRQAQKLVEVGLWYAETKNGIPGYRYHDWADFQRSADSVHEERAKARERAKQSRLSKRSSGERAPERAAERSGEASTNVRVVGGRARQVPAHLRAHAPAPTREAATNGHPETLPPADTSKRSGEPNPDVRVESHDSRALTPWGGSFGREVSSSERATSQNAQKPPKILCEKHAQMPPDQAIPPCGGCKRLRLEAEQRAEQHAADEAFLAEVDAHAEADRAARRHLIDSCPDCDHNGMREFGDLVGHCTHPKLETAS